MESILSKDGTRIGFARTGSGPPLILVHGSGGTHARWRAVLPALEARFTVYAMDRRGRGESLEDAPYAIDREAEDIAAVVDSVGAPADLVAHSYGGICSLEACLLTDRVKRLVLYEPPIPIDGLGLYTLSDLDKLEALMAKGDRAGVLEYFMRDLVGMPEREYRSFTLSSVYPARVAAAHTFPREMRAHAGYVFRPERFRGLLFPALLLLGGDSPPFFQAAIEAVHAALGNSQVTLLPGQKHFAMDAAPELFAGAVLDFLGPPLKAPASHQ